jgi:hypothetical protein
MASTKINQLESEGLAVIAVGPESLTAILLHDTWHEITNAKLIQFAVAPSASPPKPNKLYPALSYRDSESKRVVITPLSQVLAFQSPDIEE